MIYTIVLVCVFNCYHISYVLHYTYHLAVSLRIRTNVAYLVVGDVVTFFAENYVTFQLVDTIGEQLYIALVLLDKMQSESQRRPFSNAWKLGNLVYCIL